MKKLEHLEVTSFATTADAPRDRGTVAGAAAPTRACPPETYNPDRCGDTLYFDCTLGCSMQTDCPNGCVLM